MSANAEPARQVPDRHAATTTRRTATPQAVTPQKKNVQLAISSLLLLAWVGFLAWIAIRG